MQIIITEELTYQGQQEVFEIETRGDLRYLPPHIQMVFAQYGTFERTDCSTLLYSATIERENGQIIHNYESEYVDDYTALKNSNVLALY